jgi:hypothetical protein
MAMAGHHDIRQEFVGRAVAIKQCLLNDMREPGIRKPSNRRRTVEEPVDRGKGGGLTGCPPAVRALACRWMKGSLAPAGGDRHCAAGRHTSGQAKRDEVHAAGNVEVRQFATPKKTVHGRPPSL